MDASSLIQDLGEPVRTISVGEVVAVCGLILALAGIWFRLCRLIKSSLLTREQFWRDTNRRLDTLEENVGKIFDGIRNLHQRLDHRTVEREIERRGDQKRYTHDHHPEEE